MVPSARRSLLSPGVLRSCSLSVALLLLGAGPGVGAQSSGAPDLAVQPVVRPLLPETAFFDRVDGRILHLDANDTWLFETTGEVRTPTYRVSAGARFALLPSSTLTRLIADVSDRAAPRYRLSARVARYAGRNYLLPTYFLPLSRFKDEPEPPEEATPTADNDPNQKPKVETPRSEDSEFTIPPEVLEQLKKQRPPRGMRKTPGTAQKTAAVPDDRVLVDCVGLIQTGRPPAPTSGSPVPDRRTPDPSGPAFAYHSPGVSGTDPTGLLFVPYALGWNLSDERYVLLPCATLEQAVQRQAKLPERIRFNVAGLVTEFQGRKYLLLQRTAVVYNYGNFAR